MSAKQKTAIAIGAMGLMIAILFWWRSCTLPQPTSGGVAHGSSPAGSKESPSPSTSKPEVDQGTFEALNHQNIVFYGRALDQFGEPVAGADVRGVVIVNTGGRSGEMERKTTTDGQGYFKFAGFKGQDLGIGLSKEGYEYRRQNSSFSYTAFEADNKRHVPDPKNPVIFVLWKKQGAEPLVYYNKTYWEVPAEGSPFQINLATGAVGGDQADLTITLIRTPLQMVFGTTGYGWKTGLEIANGGLIRIGEQDYYNLAPDTGYLPRFEHIQEAQDVRSAKEGRIKWSWQDGMSEEFFVMSLGGKRYARLKVAVQANPRNDNDTRGAVVVTVWLNPNGSRNLEFDASKAIRPKNK